MDDAIDPRIEKLLLDFRAKERATDAGLSAMRRAIAESPYLAQLIEGPHISSTKLGGRNPDQAGRPNRLYP